MPKTRFLIIVLIIIISSISISFAMFLTTDKKQASPNPLISNETS